MRYGSGQFGAFDGLDNRKAIMNLMVRLGHGLDEMSAAKKRARFLQRLLPASTSGFFDKPMTVTPCSAVEAYHLFVAITGVLGVPIDVAARKLEDEIRRA
jgi:hypothetical protein